MRAMTPNPQVTFQTGQRSFIRTICRKILLSDCSRLDIRKRKLSRHSRQIDYLGVRISLMLSKPPIFSWLKCFSGKRLKLGIKEDLQPWLIGRRFHQYLLRSLRRRMSERRSGNSSMSIAPSTVLPMMQRDKDGAHGHSKWWIPLQDRVGQASNRSSTATYAESRLSSTAAKPSTERRSSNWFSTARDLEPEVSQIKPQKRSSISTRTTVCERPDFQSIAATKIDTNALESERQNRPHSQPTSLQPTSTSFDANYDLQTNTSSPMSIDTDFCWNMRSHSPATPPGLRFWPDSTKGSTSDAGKRGWDGCSVICEMQVHIFLENRPPAIPLTNPSKSIFNPVPAKFGNWFSANSEMVTGVSSLSLCSKPTIEADPRNMASGSDSHFVTFRIEVLQGEFPHESRLEFTRLSGDSKYYKLCCQKLLMLLYATYA
ncbi:hypothetical protein BC830DRAFT_583203 [Chytriomyces sp. MP71]|nr:hypothetical protein BC830DRAFT_583203 [Chytriomyces sp. MP71]